MIVFPSLVSVGKYAFLTLVVSSAGYLIGNVIVLRQHMAPQSYELVYHPRSPLPPGDMSHSLDPGFERCILRPTKKFCRMDPTNIGARANRTTLRRKGNAEMKDQDSLSRAMGELLLDFYRVFNSLNLTAVLLEPSVLFCVVSPRRKLRLLRTGFRPTRWQGNQRVITLGLLEAEVELLEQEEVLSKMAERGLSVTHWLGTEGRTTHLSIARNMLSVHAVVLQKKGHYLKYEALYLSQDSSLFYRAAAMDNITAVPIQLEEALEVVVHLPADPLDILYQISTSEILECQFGAGLQSPDHPFLTQEQLQLRAFIAVQELKDILMPLFIQFWLWSRSLADWISSCDPFSSASQLNFAVFSTTSENDVNWTALLSENEYLKFVDEDRQMGKTTRVVLDCFGLLINLSVCEEGNKTMWCYDEMQIENVTTRSLYPDFRLCSGDLVGLRVLVPCNAKELVQTTANHVDF